MYGPVTLILQVMQVNHFGFLGSFDFQPVVIPALKPSLDYALVPDKFLCPVRALRVVGKLFIDIADIYCFGTGLPISRSKHVFQYRHFK